MNVVLLTDGGQSVTSYKVSLYCSNICIEDLKFHFSYIIILQISIIGNDYISQAVIPLVQLITHNLTVDNLTQGEYYSTSITATNSVGMSEPLLYNFSIPCKCNYLMYIIVFYFIYVRMYNV